MVANVKQIIIPDFLSQQIHCSNGAFSFLNETSHEEFVSRPVRCIILYDICTFTYANRRFHVLFSLAKKKTCHRHVNGFGDILFISLLCNRARSFKKYFAYNKQLG